MGMSPYFRALRERVGHRLVLTPGVVGIVRDGEGRVLLQRRADNGAWALPAGAIDPGETPAEAVAREVREETGLVVEPLRIVGVFGGAAFRVTYGNGDETEYTSIVFECVTRGGTLAPVDGEATELRYVAPEEIPRLDLPYPRELFARPGPDATLFQRI